MKQLLSGILLAMVGWSAQPAVASEEADPWEGFNRAIFAFNDTLDRFLLKPVAIGYDAAMPDPLQSGVSNFFNNLGEVKNIFNDLLQAKFRQAGLDSTRMLVNTTVGFAGFIDIGSRIGLEPHDEDFGQTLGYWGVGSGPYLVLPLLGPSTIRDAAGLPPDIMIHPSNLVEHDLTRYSIDAVGIVDIRASLLEAEKLVAGDRYTFFREAYLQRRDFLLKDGVVEDNFDEDDALFDDDESFEDTDSAEPSE
ncbi:MAG TPA: VacJ family lipoprotein [Dongiaceae bacterium]|nr:VacJ family lipoprotein [Dongiaceae bacterium]